MFFDIFHALQRVFQENLKNIDDYLGLYTCSLVTDKPYIRMVMKENGQKHGQIALDIIPHYQGHYRLETMLRRVRQSLSQPIQGQGFYLILKEKRYEVQGSDPNHVAGVITYDFRYGQEEK